MKKFVIAIEETVTQNFDIEAENAESAMKIVEEKYRNSELVLEPGNVCFKQMAVMKPNGEETEWIEF